MITKRVPGFLINLSIEELNLIILEEVRTLALAFPSAVERSSHGAICFFIQNNKPLCYYHDNHRNDGKVSLWCPVYLDLQQELIRSEPSKYFKPQTSSSGTFREWIGIYLQENEPEWERITGILEDAFRKIASARLIAQYEDDKVGT